MSYQMNFVCKDRKISPSIGIPVRVLDEALKRKNLSFDLRGGIIEEDLTFTDHNDRLHVFFRVKHATGSYTWSAEDLVEIGGIELGFMEDTIE